MFKPLLTRLLNHLVTQNSWARAELLPFSGKTVALNMPPVRASLTILEDGGLAMTGEALQADASIQLSPSLALRLLANDVAAMSQVQIEGETELAKTLAKVLQNIQWDYEEDLSKLIGDIPANKLSTFAKNTAQQAKQQTVNLLEMATEYWQEEHALIAKKRHVEAFVQQVDTLRDDVARAEKRLAQLLAKSTQHTET
ncbi:MAG: ubiquinone biosynthesis accessory factor UbiJ [Candidatus Methylopumilus sp.]